MQSVIDNLERREKKGKVISWFSKEGGECFFFFFLDTWNKIIKEINYITRAKQPKS